MASLAAAPSRVKLRALHSTTHPTPEPIPLLLSDPDPTAEHSVLTLRSGNKVPGYWKSQIEVFFKLFEIIVANFDSTRH